MRRVVAMTLVAVFAVFAGVAQAQDKPNPTGTWKWEVMRKDQKFEQTLKLKLDGDKLTGAMVGRDGAETAIEDAKFKDGEISFKVTIERGGQKRSTKYSGKITGDTIKGKAEPEGGKERDWEAKRAK